ncbi:hypothetical protein ACQPZK_23695 [Micromonospora sp. CA-249363]|uniref:hypothetical protein n=1 Tax=Micromonospora sp. CA-249363 TaxID=3239963 RepID=UPI003D8F3CF0
MAWDWVVAPVVAGVVGLAGIASTWSIGLRDRKIRSEERKEQRRSEVYIDLLVQVSHDIIDAIPLVGAIGGAVPQPRKPEDGILLSARLEAFGTREVRRRYTALLEEIENIRGLRATIDRRREGTPLVSESEVTQSLSTDELWKVNRAGWQDLLKLRDELTDQIRRELGELPMST